MHLNSCRSLSNFVLPGGTASSNRYWEKDIIMPEVVAVNGNIEVPQTAEIGYAVDRQAVESFTVAKKNYK